MRRALKMRKVRLSLDLHIRLAPGYVLHLSS